MKVGDSVGIKDYLGKENARTHLTMETNEPVDSRVLPKPIYLQERNQSTNATPSRILDHRGLRS